MLSTDQLRLQVDAFARYRIVDPLRMYISARTEENVSDAAAADPRLGARNELGRRPFAALLSPERGQMMDNIQNALNRVARQYGAEIVDVRIKRADLPDGTPLDSAYRADAHRAPAGGALDPGAGPEAGADHPRRGRCRGRRHLCRRVQPGSGILRFLSRDAVLRGELHQPAGTARIRAAGPASSSRRTTNICGSSGATARRRRAAIIQSPFSRSPSLQPRRASSGRRARWPPRTVKEGQRTCVTSMGSPAPCCSAAPPRP